MIGNIIVDMVDVRANNPEISSPSSDQSDVMGNSVEFRNRLTPIVKQMMLEMTPNAPKLRPFELLEAVKEKSTENDHEMESKQQIVDESQPSSNGYQIVVTNDSLDSEQGAMNISSASRSIVSFTGNELNEMGVCS